MNTEVNIPQVDELAIQNYFKSLQLPFNYRCEIEYNQLLSKNSIAPPKVVPYILMSFDKMLSPEERLLVPTSYQGIRTMMEFSVTLDTNDESVKQEIEQMSQDLSSDEGDSFSSDEDIVEDENKMKL
ncbi:hypothetical protein DLAC_05204 [Tieghemostelium lacteum]|uniref:Uncharacterized protein n=1 Tax=Tieghemostelium lacteum TaxID=361077 RepID=A0A151ZII6_TIELA|nr:hypothetical protein DLAC_05204 [Tieghemostelium lacteum]|eukprot:KYQ93808.1 hypothetical protein DLAC_05204 [Tieghemostelium lacteum]